MHSEEGIVQDRVTPRLETVMAAMAVITVAMEALLRQWSVDVTLTDRKTNQRHSLNLVPSSCPRKR